VTSAPHPYLFTQTGLDSGALTLLGSVVHKMSEPGEYRGTVAGPAGASAVFYLTVTKEPGVTQVNIDLATLTAPPASGAADCGCSGGGSAGGGNVFTVGLHGYLIFHLSGGAGGHAVRLGRASAEPAAKVFDSTQLKDGDIFAASLLRPGAYKVSNALRKGAPAADLTVAYPQAGKGAYAPPSPLRVEATAEGFRPSKLELTAMQGCLFVCATPSRIVVELISALDPPAS
jgi:hypothetical protein